MAAGYQIAVAHPNQAYKQATVVDSIKQFGHQRHQLVVCGRVGNFPLKGLGLKIGKTNFHGDTAGKFTAPAQLIGKVFSHCTDDGLQFSHIDGVVVKGAFGRNGFALGMLNHRRRIDSLGFFPDAHPVFSERVFHHLYG